MASSEDMLKNTVESMTRPYNTYASNYTQLKDIYQTEYPKNWKEEMISNITQERRETNPNYQRESARRQVNRYEAYMRGERGKETARNPNKPMGAMKTTLRELGQKQEPIKKDVPPGGLTITVKGKQGSGRKERSREFTAKMDRATAQKFVQNPNLHDLFAEIYPDWADAVETLFGDDSAALVGVSIS